MKFTTAEISYDPFTAIPVIYFPCTGNHDGAGNLPRRELALCHGSRDEGILQHWETKQLADQIELPGSMITRNKGEEVGLHTKWTASIYDSSFFFQPRLEKFRQPDNYKVPWLTPQKYYVGAAWYQKKS